MNGAADAAVETRVLPGLDPSALPDAAWEALRAASPADTVFQSRWWHEAWWRAFGRGRLAPVLALRGGRPVALAPFFVDGDMAFLVGSGGSDYLGVIGAADDAAVVTAILRAAMAAAPGLLGFRFYHAPDGGGLAGALAAAAARLDLDLFEENAQTAPALDLAASGPAVAAKPGLRRRENWFRREGAFEIRRMRAPGEIGPRLPAFFAQHIARWAGGPHPSLFLDEAQRRFYRLLVETAPAGGPLRFTEVVWNGRPVAFHFGFSHAGTYLWYKPSFDIALSRRSPGGALLRDLMLEAMEEACDVFDFGLGDEPFKARYADQARTVRDWGLYPRGRAGAARHD